jgi:PAS domain S-box-containing protein
VSLPQPPERGSAPSAWTALWLTAVYLVAAAVWIVVSDEALRRLVADATLLVRLQTIKGWAFVLVTAVVLYGVLQRRVLTLDRSMSELAARERLLEAIRRAAPVGIMVLGKDGELVSWNPGAERLLEWTAAEVGKPVPWVGPDRQAAPEWVERARDGEPLTDAEARLRKRDGTWLDVLVSTGPLVDAGDRMLGVVAVLTDVTKRRHLEAQLRQAQKMEALGQVAGGIAHDFRNVLTVMSTVAEGMRSRMPQDDAELRADLEELIQAADRGTAITRRLLAFSRLEPLDLAPLDLRHVTSEAVSVLRRLVPASIELRVEVPSTPVPARVDQNAMIHMLTNLVTNARDAMPGGGPVRIRVRRIEADSGGPGLGVIEVEDAGTGMSTQVLNQVFDPFFTTKPAGIGTGLGLPIVQGLMVEHGGSVEVHSEVGRGTTVRLRLPLAADVPVPLSTAPWPGVIRGGDETILVVEDEEAIRRSAKRALEQLGYTVLLAEDGAAALAILRAGRQVDLVVSDSVMPRLGGAELYQRLRDDGIRIPFLLASGYSAHEAVGGHPPHDLPFLPKPWTLNELTRKVRELLDGAAAARASPSRTAPAANAPEVAR